MDRKFQKLCLKDFALDNSSKLKLKGSLGNLSLGGNKSPKKKYVPNVNAIRNKDRNQNNFSRIEKPIPKPRIVRDKLKGRFIQSTEGFSDRSGPSDTPHIEKKERAKKSEKYSELTIPTVRKNHQEVDEETENSIYHAIIRSESSSPSELEENFPFKPLEWIGPGEFTKNEINPEKKLLDLLESCDSIPKITLWGFPSSFPFQVDVGSSKSTTLVDFHLTDFPPGKIGKMLIRKSGKVEAIFGNIKYELRTLLWDSYQTFVSINVDLEKSEALVLGEVDDSYMLCPNMDYLLQNECRK